MEDAVSHSWALMVLAVPFVIAWLAGVSAWFLGVAEVAALYLLRDFLFGLGPVALRRQVEIAPPSSSSLGENTKLARSQVRLLAPTRAIFSSRYVWPRSGRHKSAGPVKGTVSWFGSRAEVVVRHPLGPIAFILAWLAAWSIGSVGVGAAALLLPNRGEFIWVVPPMLLGWIFGYLMYRFLLWHGRASAVVVADEVLAYLGA
jgi:hypothetical protein